MFNNLKLSYDPVIDRIKNGEFLHSLITPEEYTCNKHYYRAPEFDTIDWANSAVIFGCSNVFGVGVYEEDTLSSQLSKMIGIPVINMGCGGTSMEFSFHNAMILNNSHPTPKAVINIWTSIDRTTYYSSNWVANKGVWCPDDEYTKAYNREDSHPKIHALFYQMISKQIWMPKTKYYEASLFEHTAEALDINFPGWVDTGWDGIHPGPKTLYNIALTIKESLWT